MSGGYPKKIRTFFFFFIVHLYNVVTTVIISICLGSFYPRQTVYRFKRFVYFTITNDKFSYFLLQKRKITNSFQTDDFYCTYFIEKKKKKWVTRYYTNKIRLNMLHDFHYE